MAKVKATPTPWLIAMWPRKGALDNVETVITDSRGHGLFVACHKGRHTKTLVNAQRVIDAINACTDLDPNWIRPMCKLMEEIQERMQAALREDNLPTVKREDVSRWNTWIKNMLRNLEDK
jgi:hypothetical protein